MGCSNSKGEPSIEKQQQMKQLVTQSEIERDLDIQLNNCKVVLLGNSSVGKTSICERAITNEYSVSYQATTGAAYRQLKINLDSNRSLRLHIWDTGGEEKFRAIAAFYYRDAKGALLIYDATNRKSFEDLGYWKTELAQKIANENMVIVLVANKVDLPNGAVSDEEAQKFASDSKMLFHHTSAKTGEGITELFHHLGEKFYEAIIAPLTPNILPK